MTSAGVITHSTAMSTTGAAPNALRRVAVVASLLLLHPRGDPGPRGPLAAGLEDELAGRLVVAQ